MPHSLQRRVSTSLTYAAPRIALLASLAFGLHHFTARAAQNVAKSGTVRRLAIVAVSPKITLGPVFTQLCDGSAVAPLQGYGSGRPVLSFAAASDESDDQIRTRLATFGFASAQPRDWTDVSTYLAAAGDEKDNEHPEADIEGATRVGTRIYWIGSHGRDKKGKRRRSRERFFATDITAQGLKPVGGACGDLLDGIAAASPVLAQAAASKLPPKDGGINIEALCGGPTGELWLGFRSPLINQKAIILPLQNPDAVLVGKKARLGTPMALDLGGRGLRDMQRAPDGSWIIIAGPVGSGDNFALYHWNGPHGGAPRPLFDCTTALAHRTGLGDFAPEGLLVNSPSDFWLLSDDGGLAVGSLGDNKKLPSARRTFRSIHVQLPRQ